MRRSCRFLTGIAIVNKFRFKRTTMKSCAANWSPQMPTEDTDTMPTAKIFSTARLDAYAEGVLGQFGDLVFATDTKEATMIKEIDGAVAFVVRGGMLPIRKAVIDQ